MPLYRRTTETGDVDFTVWRFHTEGGVQSAFQLASWVQGSLLQDTSEKEILTGRGEREHKKKVTISGD